MPQRDGRSTPLVLIASTDAALCALLEGALAGEGFELARVAEAGAVAETVARLAPDAVLLDAPAPRDACGELRALHSAGAAAPALLLVVRPRASLAPEAACAAGAADFVEVASSGSLIAHRLRRAIEARAATLERDESELLGALRDAARELGSDLAGERGPGAVRMRMLEGSHPRALLLVDAESSHGEELLLLAERAAELARLADVVESRGRSSEALDRRRRRADLEGALRTAIEQDAIDVHYQPKLELKRRQIVGMEALARWTHPTLGPIPPSDFIPLAERSGLIVPLGEAVLRRACRQARLWQDLGLQPVRMAVNLSQVQFRQPDLFKLVSGILDEAGLAPQWLELELTESMLMHDAPATVRSLGQLAGAGIHLSIDDFGTGYSSLSYLRRFPIDALKIDQSFVREVTSDPDDAAIVTSIILLGHSLKLSVIAEGVESESQLSFLEVLQCDEIQGYLISPPVPADKAEAFLSGGRR